MNDFDVRQEFMKLWTHIIRIWCVLLSGFVILLIVIWGLLKK